MHEKCNDCINRDFIGTKYENSLCGYCRLEEATRELKKGLKETVAFKLLIKIADFLSQERGGHGKNKR